MAYVGTPTRLATPRDTLASIIAGEASGEGVRGMQAVAQVISNRAAQNFGGYGRDLISQATARMQFQGQSARPSAAAYSVADQALAGQLPNIVGSGAVNYANPGDSSARWARRLDESNSFKLGNHYFTDNTSGRAYSPNLSTGGTEYSGVPASDTWLTGGTAPPAYSGVPASDTWLTGGTAPPAYSGVPASASWLKNGDGQYSGEVGSNITGFKQNADGSADVVLGFDGGGSGPGMGSGVQQTTGFDSTGGFTGANVAGGSQAGAFGLGGVTSGGQAVGGGLGPAGTGNPNGYSLDGATLDPNVNAGNVADPIVGYNAAGPVMGAPTVTAAINTSGQKVSGSVDKGAKTIGDDTKKAGETIGKSVDTFGSTVSKLSSSWQDLFSETFLRLAFIVVGLVLFAAALWYFARPQVTAVAGAVADVIPAGRVAKAATGLARRAKRA